MDDACGGLEVAPTSIAPLRDRDRLRAEVDRLIAAIDRALTDQVNAILHHPRFQRLEAGWRSLHLLVQAASGVEGAKIRVLPVSWSEVCRDLERAADFDQSVLFARIYSDEFGMPGGEPYGLLIGDYEVQNRFGPGHVSDDVAALGGLSAIAAAAFAPMILGCAPATLGVERFSDLTPNTDLSAVFQGAEHARFARFQAQEDARFLGLALPRVLVRAPYADDGTRCDGFRFRENAEAPDGRELLWGNAAFAFGAVVLRAFANHGWLADIRGARLDEVAGGLVTHLPRADFATDRRGVAVRAPLEIGLTERQERALSEQGLLPLVRARETPYCVFNSCQSVQQLAVQQPAGHLNDAAGANARLSALLSAMLCVSRFAHFIKVLARDRVGSVSTPEQCQAWIEDWLRGYVMGNDDASVEMKARYPLRDGRVQVVEPPGRPGHFECIIHLQPHFQFEQAVASFRLTTRVAARAGT
ncbi:type VI secretion system protein ImpD [Azospirillum brasilense]|uniref:Type VI secretion system protein ImpD n=1 Tax=Azospirillum brasilense TaxID=192 RepID=A0A560BBJ9_AZOBR|nr:type VI secretion system contractile sheath large subunit [Azospirillum brasilense]TWA70028.1 type VI secretion system protein ImpD [Azospirillum brasilense]